MNQNLWLGLGLETAHWSTTGTLGLKIRTTNYRNTYHRPNPSQVRFLCLRRIMGPKWSECNACQNSVGNRTLPHKTWANIQTTDYLGLELFLLLPTTEHSGLGTGAMSGVGSQVD